MPQGVEPSGAAPPPRAAAAHAPVRFRVATEADVPALVALVESAYRGEASRAGWTTEADLLAGQRTDPEEVGALIAAPDSRVLIAEDGAGHAASRGAPVACCQLRRDGGPPGPTAAYFGMFAVRPIRQGGGLGTLLLAEAERSVVRLWGATEMRMKVLSARHDLIAWYERRGYARTGRRSPFPYGDERFGIPRRSDLAFDVLAKPLPPLPRTSPSVGRPA